jgi:hypothetical protein
MRVMLSNYAVVITKEGPMGVQSRDEVKDIIMHHFGIRKHKFYVFRSFHEPGIAIFMETNDRDVVFVVSIDSDEPIELCFHALDIDLFRDRENLPY